MGRWEGEAFLAYLDDAERVIPYPLLWGMEVFWWPRPWFSLQIRRTILFGGAGRTERLTPGRVLDILLGRRENLEPEARGPGDSDQLLSYALVWIWEADRIPGLWLKPLGLRRVTLYYEYGGEDALKHGLPTAVGHLGGWRAEGALGRLEMAYAETVDRTNPWYEHVVYRSGYRYRGWILGHPPGGNTRWLRLAWESPPEAPWGAAMRWTWEKGRVFDPRPWEVVRLALAGRWPLGTRLRGSVALERDWPTRGEAGLPDRFARWHVRLGLWWDPRSGQRCTGGNRMAWG
jgi:hypothetical protein